MRFMAFAIYILNLAIVVFSALQSAFFKHSDLAGSFSIMFRVTFIALFITAFILKKICEDDYLAEHFAYQFKAMMVMFLYGLVLVIGLVLIASLLGGFDKSALISLVAPFMVLLIIVGIISFILLIWFLYRNIKGLIYLSLNKDL